MREGLEHKSFFILTAILLFFQRHLRANKKDWSVSPAPSLPVELVSL